jgi:hypothetical protein
LRTNMDAWCAQLEKRIESLERIIYVDIDRSFGRELDFIGRGLSLQRREDETDVDYRTRLRLRQGRPF